MRALALSALLCCSCICGELDREYERLLARADAGERDGGAGGGAAGGAAGGGGGSGGGSADGGMCKPNGAACAAEPNSCCLGLCCASNGTNTFCTVDPPLPPYLCVL